MIRKSKKKKIIINIVSILMMATGPFLMILPGPQIISWVGLFMFLMNNVNFFSRYLWIYYIICWVEWKISRIKKIKIKKYYI